MKTKNELMAMGHEDLVNMYIESESSNRYYKERAEKMVKLLTGIFVNMEAFCSAIQKTL